MLWTVFHPSTGSCLTYLLIYLHGFSCESYVPLIEISKLGRVGKIPSLKDPVSPEGRLVIQCDSPTENGDDRKL